MIKIRRKVAPTLVYSKACSAVHSDFDVGFESAKIIGNCNTCPCQEVFVNWLHLVFQLVSGEKCCKDFASLSYWVHQAISMTLTNSTSFFFSHSWTQDFIFLWQKTCITQQCSECWSTDNRQTNKGSHFLVRCHFFQSFLGESTTLSRCPNECFRFECLLAMPQCKDNTQEYQSLLPQVI